MAKATESIRELSDEEVTQTLATGDTTTGTSGISDIQGEAWAETVFEYARPMRRFRQIAREVTSLIGTGQDTIHLPRTTSNLDVSFTFTEGSDRTYTKLDNINTLDITVGDADFKRGGIAIGQQTQETTMVNLVEHARRQIAEAMSQDLDEDIRSQLVSDAANNVDQSTSGTLTPDSIAAAMDNIESNNFDPQWLVVSSSHMKDLRQDSQFTNAAEYGSDRVVLNGEVGEYLGLRVMKSTNISNDANDKAVMVGTNEANESIGPVVVWKQRPSVGVEFHREDAEHRIYYDQAYATGTLQPDAVCTIQTS